MLFDAEHFNAPHADMFSGQYWSTKNSIIGQASGRGTTYFFVHDQQEYVLRHYFRGGLMGKILDDQYLYTGLNNTRAGRELRLLAKMRALDLPCPAPIAALINRRGLYYQADIILGKIADAQDLFERLIEAPLNPQVWQNIGATIAAFHNQQIYHHDLNMHNIMLDRQQKSWLIDFDKCAIRVGHHWKAANLARLHRSLAKEQKAHGIHWTATNWQQLLKAYQAVYQGELGQAIS
jgi:3-deoxy-D-manno-octulosonic acid kinase